MCGTNIVQNKWKCKTKSSIFSVLFLNPVNSLTVYFSVLNDLKPFADFIIKSENTSDYYHYYYQCSATHNTHVLLDNVGGLCPPKRQQISAPTTGTVHPTPEISLPLAALTLACKQSPLHVATMQTLCCSSGKLYCIHATT